MGDKQASHVQSNLVYLVRAQGVKPSWPENVTGTIDRGELLSRAFIALHNMGDRRLLLEVECLELPDAAAWRASRDRLE